MGVWKSNDGVDFVVGVRKSNDVADFCEVRN